MNETAAHTPPHLEATPVPEPEAPRTHARLSWPVTRLLIQIAITACFLLAWQYLPDFHWVTEHIRWTNRFFISSPTSVAKSLRNLATGHGTQGVTLWPYLEQTVRATIEGTAIGFVIGAVVGLLFSNSPRLNEVFDPFVVLMNSVPRIALIPIFILVAGPTINAEILSIVFVVFFLAFFNALEGGRSVSQASLDNALLLGAGPIDVMRTIRLPAVLHWTFASLPNAISFGLIVAVTTELLAGLRGMGNLLLNAIQNIDASYTFAIIVVLAVVGLLLAVVGRIIESLVIRW